MNINGYNFVYGNLTVLDISFDKNVTGYVSFDIDGKEYTADELAAISPIKGMTAHSIVNRINCRNKTIEEAIENNTQAIAEGVENWINKEYTNNKNKIQCSAPTISQVLEWLRKEKKILIV